VCRGSRTNSRTNRPVSTHAVTPQP
jgi:hypothetical protein